MQLIEGRSRHLPVRFLIEIAQGHGVGKQQVELLGHFQADIFFEFQGQRVRNRTVSLDFAGVLMNARLCTDCGLTAGTVPLRHKDLLMSSNLYSPVVNRFDAKETNACWMHHPSVGCSKTSCVLSSLPKLKERCQRKTF